MSMGVFVFCITTINNFVLSTIWIKVGVLFDEQLQKHEFCLKNLCLIVIKSLEVSLNRRKTFIVDHKLIL